MPDLFVLNNIVFWSDLNICIRFEYLNKKRDLNLGCCLNFKLNLTIVVFILFIYLYQVYYVSGGIIFYLAFGNFFQLNLNCYNGSFKMKAEEFAVCCHSLCVPILIAWKSRIILTFHIPSLKIDSSSLPPPSPLFKLYLSLWWVYRHPINV